MTDVRRKILDASVALVAEEGVRALSFREVARRAGVSHQTPYHHFGSDVGILRELAREGFSALTTALQAAAANQADALEALCAAGRAYVDFARSHVGHFRVMFEHSLVAVREAAPIPEAEATHATLFSICDGVRRAGWGRGLSTEALTNVNWAFVHGLATLIVEGSLRSTQREDVLVKKTINSMRALLAKTPG
jgi:AcrR family transcriptional regulator